MHISFKSRLLISGVIATLAGYVIYTLIGFINNPGLPLEQKPGAVSTQLQDGFYISYLLAVVGFAVAFMLGMRFIPQWLKEKTDSAIPALSGENNEWPAGNGQNTAINGYLGNKDRRLFDILQNNADACMVVSGDQNITFLNRRAESLFKIKGGDVIGLSLWDALPELGSHLYKPMHKVFSGTNNIQTEAHYAPLDLWLEVGIVGDAESAAINIRDITSRKQAEQALRKNEYHQRAILNNIADGIVTTDMGGVILSFNTAAERIFGYSAAEATGHTLDILMDKGMARMHDRFMRHYQHSEESVTIGLTREVSAKRKDGSLFPIEIAITEMPTDDGLHFIGIIRDITERKQSEEQLRLAERIFESNNEAIVITDSEARILRVNEAFGRITGYTDDEVIGKTPRILSSGKHDKEFFRKMWGRIMSIGHWQGEIWNKRKSGEMYPEWLSISAVKDKQDGIINFVGIFSDITEKKAAEERIFHMAHHDALTGLFNRTMFDLDLNDAIEHSYAGGNNLAILYIDLDHFKKVNDTLGHPVGDELLKIIANRLMDALRASDVVCRIGGDEFIVLLKNITHPQFSGNVAKSLIEKIMQPIELEGRELFVGASIGIATYPQDAANADQLVRNADAALFRAKQQGRNNYQFYSNEMNARAMERLDMETKLRHALENDEFILHFQPQLDLQESRITGVEALIRWIHPKLGLVPPLEFISLLEETGLIIAVGEWVLSKACERAMAWRQAGLGDIRIAVNISPHQFQYSDIVSAISSALDRSGLPHGLLELEITEGSIMSDADNNIRRLHQVTAMGVQLAIDDFGTGYSSLAYLKRFPINALKVDQSFVRNMHIDDSDKNIVAAIASLGKSLGLRIIAEGVEEAEQLKLLKVYGCEEAQGYYISHPLEEHKLVDFLTTGTDLCTAVQTHGKRA